MVPPRDAPRRMARSLHEGEGVARMTLTELLKLDIDASDPANRDPEFIRSVALPFLNAVRSYYFRWEAEGAEQVPSDGPFITVANHNGVPILPVVNAGGHEVYLTLFSSQRLAEWTGIARLTRVKTLPVNLGLPWGLWATGFVPFLPLPAKLSYKVGEPIHVGHDPEAARRPDVVRGLYRKVTGIMQDMLDELAGRRRLPVIG